MKVASLNATNGYNVVFSGIPEKADFYADNVTKTTTKVQVPVGYEFVNATEEPLYLTASSLTVKKDADGNPIDQTQETDANGNPIDQIAETDAEGNPID